MRFPVFISNLFSPSADVGALQAASFIRFGLVWVIYIGLAWSGIPMEWIAGYEWFLFLANLFSFALINGGKKAILNLSGGDSSKGGLARISFAVFNVAGLLLAGLFLLLQPWFVGLPEDFGEFGHTAPLTVYIFLLVASSTLDFLLLILKKYRWIVWQSIVFNGALVLAVLIPLNTGAGLQTAFWLMCVVLGVQWMTTAFIAFSGPRSAPSLNLREFLAQGILPLSAFALFGGLSQFVDGYLVAFLNESAADFAIYRYGARELPLSAFLAGGVAAAMIPAVLSDKNEGLNRLAGELRILYRQLFPLNIGLMLLSPFIFPLVFTNDFAASAGFFNIYLLVLSSRLLLPQVFLIAAKKNSTLLVAGGVEVVLNVLLSVLLYQLWGIYGIAWATVVAYLASKLIMGWYAVFRLDVPLRGLLLPGKYAMYLSVLIAAYVISTTYTAWI